MQKLYNLSIYIVDLLTKYSVNFDMKNERLFIYTL